MRSFKIIFLLSLFIFTSVASAQVDNQTKQLAHDIFKQLIEINTTNTSTPAAEAMAQRFRDAGFSESDIHLVGPTADKKNLVVRLRGTNKLPPILLMGHLDVVAAERRDWSMDPFKFIEKDGYYYGRGTQDMKDDDAIMVAALIKMKKDGFIPNRDIILALTADEEGGDHNGVDWLIKNKTDLIHAAFVINSDDTSLWTTNGKTNVMEIIASEKNYSDYQLVVTDSGGHSSLPKAFNPIYVLSNALVRLQHYQFPAELNEISRVYYQKLSMLKNNTRAADMKAVTNNPLDSHAAERLSQNPLDNAMLHTTCVATRLNAGVANNALPQRAEAIINCRIIPGHAKEEIRDTLIKIVNNPAVTVQLSTSNSLATTPVFVPHPLQPTVFHAIETAANQLWNGITVVPTISSGASDGVYTSAAGMPTYMVSGVAIDRDGDREHGKDERIGINDFYQGLDFWYRFITTLTTQ